jgi:RNA polymerase sigma-70 factor (ECF subfamily)
MTMDNNTIAGVLFRERGRLYAYIWSIVHDPGIAEDVFQDVCLLAIRQCSTIENDQHLMAWFRQVARHRAIDALRRQNRAPVLLDATVLDLLENDWAGEDTTSMAHLVPMLRDCLKQLTSRARQIVKLRYVDGLSAAKVAEAMQARVEAIYQSLWRIHQTLGKCVEQQTARGQEEAMDHD